MEREKGFLETVFRLAVPVALQSMLQASFQMADQIMIGQLGSTGIAAIGLAGKFASVFSVIVSAVSAVAGIMISQYIGQKNEGEVQRSFFVNLLAAVGLSVIFMFLCMAFPNQIMGFYTTDKPAINSAAGYLGIYAWTFLPAAGASMVSVLLRCKERASLPLIAGIIAVVCNTLLNYILIFGKFGADALGVNGAAVATVISQVVNFLLIVFMLLWQKVWHWEKRAAGRFDWNQYSAMLLPVLVCEFMWSLGENVYAGIYGHLGTQACAAMTLINPVQGLMIGALCGLSQAAGIIIGKLLGNSEYEEAYCASKKLIWYGFAGAVFLSVVIVLTRTYYVQIYQVEESVRQLTEQILAAYAVVAPFKVLNMILGGGIIRSGGKTTYVMLIDLIGTWGFGVPLGLFAAFVLKLSIPYVYFLLSLEECVRFGISLAVFRRRGWMQSLKA